MAIQLTSEQEQRIQAVVNAGAYPSSEDALDAAVAAVEMAATLGSAEDLSFEKWQKELEEWLDGAPNIPALSDEAISREGIYTREDARQVRPSKGNE